MVLPVGSRLKGELPAHLTLEKCEYDVFSRADADDLIARYNETLTLLCRLRSRHGLLRQKGRGRLASSGLPRCARGRRNPPDRSRCGARHLDRLRPPGRDAHGDPGRLCRLSVMIGPTIAGASFSESAKPFSSEVSR